MLQRETKRFDYLRILNNLIKSHYLAYHPTLPSREAVYKDELLYFFYTDNSRSNCSNDVRLNIMYPSQWLSACFWNHATNSEWKWHKLLTMYKNRCIFQVWITWDSHEYTAKWWCIVCVRSLTNAYIVLAWVLIDLFIDRIRSHFSPQSSFVHQTHSSHDCRNLDDDRVFVQQQQNCHKLTLRIWKKKQQQYVQKNVIESH